jgi:serine protease Do
MMLYSLKRFVALSAASLLLLGTLDASNANLDVARQLNQAFIQVADEVSASVVIIKLAHKANYINLDEEGSPLWEMLPPEFRKQLRDQQERQKKRENKGTPEEPVFDGQGSGVVLRDEGYILTNGHVVEEAEKIKVRFKDDSEWYDAEVRGVDTQSDLAVLKVNAKGKKLTAVKMGDSSKVRVGEFAIAIGAPFELDYSVTFGHVSAKGRSRLIPDNRMDQDFIQTDASINPGNSGGPLVNIDGEVIGINTLIRGLRTGIGFAIPVNLVKEVADRLVSDGKYARSYLGVGIRSLSEYPELREVIPGIKDGVLVSEITPNAPVADSDLKAGDVITAVDGIKVTTSQQLRNEVRPKKIGQTVVLDVFRKGQELKIKVKTGAWPEEPKVVAQKSTPKPEGIVKELGMTLQNLTPELAEQFGVDKTKGVIVTEVESGSPADGKLSAGDIITEVNRKAVTNTKEFQDNVKKGDLKKGIVINFQSKGTSKFEVIKKN